MFEYVLQMTERVAKASNTTYLDEVLRSFERHRQEVESVGGKLDPLTLAAWGQFEQERKLRAAKLTS